MCPYCRNGLQRTKKKGFFTKKSTRAERIQRYLCLECNRSFSDQTGKLTYREHKPHVDQPLYRLLASGVSQRRCAEILGVHQITVARKLVRLGKFARLQQAAFLTGRSLSSAKTLIFDEMETFEHTKLKPLSITVTVQEGSRVMLGAKVASMPAKGLLAERARRKYGFRPDERPEAIRFSLERVARVMPQLRTVKTDESPRYPRQVKSVFPTAEHQTFKGRRGCVVGQGEIKEGGFDPLFSLNHTCAMVRDNIKCLSRRTWCTVKRPDRLQDLVDIYTCFHNWRILRDKPHATIESGLIR